MALFKVMFWCGGRYTLPGLYLQISPGPGNGPSARGCWKQHWEFRLMSISQTVRNKSGNFVNMPNTMKSYCGLSMICSTRVCLPICFIGSRGGNWAGPSLVCCALESFRGLNGFMGWDSSLRPSLERYPGPGGRLGGKK
ncbi:hypothetical protein D3C73_1251200 [compost metagenome]